MIPVFLLLAGPWISQTVADDYRIEKDHPRLLAPARRLRLLQRERERQSIRWLQFDALMGTGAEMPEKGFAHALYFLAGGGQAHGRQAIQWALGPGGDLRQLALVFDWCQRLLTAAERDRLAGKIRAQLELAALDETVPVLRSRLMAAVALAGHQEGVAEPVLRKTVDEWWRGQVIPALRAGRNVVAQEDFYPLIELFHVVRDNFEIDLREGYPKYFANLPLFHILAHYPAPYPAPENDYRVPVMKQHVEPDRLQAVLGRAAGLSMVAFDTNSQENQFLQGWLIQDRFLMRGPLGIPYEFLWANPYQPGLSYYHVPLVFHDKRNGRLLLRSSWEEDAIWFYQSEGGRQLFRDGRIENLAELKQVIQLGPSRLLPAASPMRFDVDVEERAVYYLVGLKPESRYDLEIDDEQIHEVRTDAGGVLDLPFPMPRKARAWLHEPGMAR